MRLLAEGILNRAMQVSAQPLTFLRLKKQRTKKARFVQSSIMVLLLLLPVTFIGDRLLGSMLEHLLMQSNFRYSRLYNGTAQADVVVLGNSRGHAFYEPEIEKLSGKSVFNLSYNALPISVGRVLLEDYFERYSAEVLVLDVSMMTKTEEQVTTSFLPYQNFSPRLQALIEQTSGDTSMGARFSSLYRFNSEVFHRALYYLEGKDDDWILDKQISESLAKNSNNLEEVSFRIKKDRMDDLKQIIALAEKHNVRVSLVMGPYFPGYRDKISNLEQYMASIEQATGYKVVDYSSSVEEQEMFSDYLHLNKEGSTLFIAEMYEDKVF